MNAGFANLATLRAQLLAPSLQTRTDYDAQLLAIGNGVAAAFGNFCNRKFARTVGDTEILAADKCQFLLSRFPVEVVTAIDQKTTEAGGWVQQVINDFVTTIDLQSGIVNCPDGADAGEWYEQVRFTYTGGFFWETLEPADMGYPTAQPNGSNALPADLFEAWILQCKKVWEAVDKLGTKITEVGSNTRQPSEALAGLDMIPTVKQMLQQYVRYNLV